MLWPRLVIVAGVTVCQRLDKVRGRVGAVGTAERLAVVGEVVETGVRVEQFLHAFRALKQANRTSD